MSRFARTLLREPLGVVAVLWPLALLAPFVPGLPRPTNGGLTWRQETAVAFLLSAAFALLLRLSLKRSREAATGESSPCRRGRAGLFFSRHEILMTAALAAFAAWAASSVLWAANVFAAAHYALSWTAYLLFFVALGRAAGSPRLLRASLGLLACVVVVLSAANVVGHYGSPDSLIRQYGLGEPVAVCIPLFVAVALRLRRARAALLFGAAATLGWLSLIQIAERAPFLGVLLGLSLLAAFMAARAAFRPRGLRRVVALAAAFAFCVLLQNVPSPFAESRHQTIVTRLQATSPSEVNTRARFLYWGAAVEMWQAHPLTGVGAGGYDGAFPQARASLAAERPGSPLVEINERFLATGAHNEYLQILGELGAVGLSLFAAFCAALVWAAWRALRASKSTLAPGAFASLAVFAFSSGASSVSFRWFGSGLMFFFAAALVTKLGLAAKPPEPGGSERAPRDSHESCESREASGRGPESSPNALGPSAHPHAPFGNALAAFANARFAAFGLAASLVVLCAMCVHAANVLLLASAQSAGDGERAERLYGRALAVNPLDPATHFNRGVRLYFSKREREAIPHLRFAVARGFNTATCYAYLAGAEAGAGDAGAAERTLAAAVRVYPRSVFLRVRHAHALKAAGRAREAELEMSAALLLDSRKARGWRQLIENDIDEAVAAARRDPEAFAMPGELQPEDAVFAVLVENERRFPQAVGSGWRARMRSDNLQ